MIRSTRLTVLGGDPTNESILQDLTAFDQDIRTLELASEFAPFVIAAGVLTDRDGTPWRELIMPLANIAGAVTKVEQSKARLIETLEGLLPDSKERFALMEEIADLPYRYSGDRERAAYLLGVAVGQRLGPDAFTKGSPR
jgi:hypothetical protein